MDESLDDQTKTTTINQRIKTNSKPIVHIFEASECPNGPLASNTIFMRLLRQSIAAIVLLFSTLYIVGMAGWLPESISPDFFIKIQLVPAILSASVASLVALTALTLLLGRFYCSAICPLGISQDIIIRLSDAIKKKRHTKRGKIYYKKPHHILRYGILALSTLLLILGSSYLLLLLDPYSIFGRISATILTPLITLANNIIANITNAAGNYTLTHRDYHWPTIAVVLSTSVTLGSIVYLNIKHGRLWCNTLCPVGTLLGLVSKIALFKIQIDKDKCTNCKACAKTCKANTIDNQNGYTIDHSRCISCYNCIDACKFEALKLSPTLIKRTK